MLWIPLLGIVFYVPLYLAAFVLSIVAMSQGRIAGGITCLLLTIIMPPIMWMAGMAMKLSRYHHDEPHSVESAEAVKRVQGDIQPPPPTAIYTPKPAYRAEWAKQGLTGKGVVLLTIDKQTGNVIGAKMLQSTGYKQLDDSALEAYSQWRFDRSTVAASQLKIPIAFAPRPLP